MNFLCGGTRKHVYELDIPGHHVVRHARHQELKELTLRYLRPLAEHNECHHFVLGFGRGHTDHCRLKYGGLGFKVIQNANLPTLTYQEVDNMRADQAGSSCH